LKLVWGGAPLWRRSVPTPPPPPPRLPPPLLPASQQQVYHPNIDLDGNICLNILREDWKPVLTVASVVYGLNFLFLVRFFAGVGRGGAAAASSFLVGFVPPPASLPLPLNKRPAPQSTPHQSPPRPPSRSSHRIPTKKTGPQPGRPLEQGGSAAPEGGRQGLRAAGAEVDRGGRFGGRALLPAAGKVVERGGENEWRGRRSEGIGRDVQGGGRGGRAPRRGPVPPLRGRNTHQRQTRP
jgi:hypothetical protein